MDRTINGNTELFGIAGHPVSHSLSPVMHNSAFQFMKINAVYVPFHIKNTEKYLISSLKDIGIKGLSVTIPHKVWACECADTKDKLSEICGASNTLVFKNEKIHAFNTDGPGALRALKTKIKNLSKKKVLLLGYGGSAAAIAHSFFTENTKIASIHISGRNEEKIDSFIQKLKDMHVSDTVISGSKTLPDPESIDIIINTTPSGMTGKDIAMPIPESYLLASHTVFDIVYTPRETPLIRAAKIQNATIVYGYLMLLHQAVLQFHLFTGAEAPVDVMESALLNVLDNC